MVSVRLEDDLIRRIDKVAEQLSAQASGLAVNRSGAVRVILQKGLEALEPQKPRRKR